MVVFVRGSVVMYCNVRPGLWGTGRVAVCTRMCRVVPNPGLVAEKMHIYSSVVHIMMHKYMYLFEYLQVIINMNTYLHTIMYVVAVGNIPW